MYNKRVKIFVFGSVALLLVGVLRLVQMQLLADSTLQDEIAELKRQSGLSRQLKTIRGQILDRQGRVLAADGPRFQICINYQLASFLDDRVVQARKTKASADATNPSLYEFVREVDTRREDLKQIIKKCAGFGLSRGQVEDRIRTLNDTVWKLRTFLAWYRNDPEPNLIEKYGGVISVPLSEAIADFERRVPEARRHDLIAKVDDIPEMDKNQPLLELETDDDIFAAQVEFMDINDVQILPKAYRYYPYGPVAAQTIGWVGLATQERDKGLFENDRLASYLKGEVCGREDGVEYVCESILRGRRGEQVHDIDGRLVSDTEAEFGNDVTLTLDIELQKGIEALLTDPQRNPDYYRAPAAAVVIQVRTGDVLALVSLPTYDPRRARYDYDDLRADPNKPLINRAINKQYPPGSSVKPMILIAAMETGKVTPEEVIPCPAEPAPAGWPNCLIWRTTRRIGHSNQRINKARNAIKGSCNIYFSRIADRVEPAALQRWLFDFGYGCPAPLACPMPPLSEQAPRRFRQAPGQISSTRVATSRIDSIEDVPPLHGDDRKLVGIGQGKLWATPLQVANAFATIARGGLRMAPRLFAQRGRLSSGATGEMVDLKISQATLQVIRDGMGAVVNEPGGTAHREFANSGLALRGVKVYGKTGSTEKPEHAWFAGFTEDREGAKLAIALVVEGGLHGSSDAAPLAREIIRLCADAGYVGKADLMSPLPAGR